MRTQSILCAVTAVSLALGAHAATYDVTRYGAKPDGATDNTAAIQKAIDDCAAKGGGRVLVPGGGKYVTYTLNLKNNVELHIDRGATLLGGEDPFKYPVFETNAVWNAERSPRFNRRAMFYTVGQTNVAITGAGTIDGNAEKFHHEETHNNWTGYRWFRNSHKFKNSEEGRHYMCEAMERIEARGEARGEACGKRETMLATAKRMIESGMLAVKDIARFSGLSLAQVKKLQSEMA